MTSTNPLPVTMNNIYLNRDHAFGPVGVQGFLEDEFSRSVSFTKAEVGTIFSWDAFPCTRQGQRLPPNQ